MPKVNIDAPAPDFTLEDYQGSSITLSDYEEKQNVLLVFNRGFM
jgi:peroxiredoxin